MENFFGRLTNKAARRGVFHNVLIPNLLAAIETYLAAHNQDHKPFVWTAKTDQILEKVRLGRTRTAAYWRERGQARWREDDADLANR